MCFLRIGELCEQNVSDVDPVISSCMLKAEGLSFGNLARSDNTQAKKATQMNCEATCAPAAVPVSERRCIVRLWNFIRHADAALRGAYPFQPQKRMRHALSAERTVLRPFSVLLVLVRRHAGHLAWVVPCSKRKVRGIPPGYGSCD